MYEHLNPLKQKLLSLTIQKPPPPWQLVSSISIGGLRSVGFDKNSENLLVVSSQGRGLIDCTSGQKIARDATEYYDYEEQLEAEGIGILANIRIRMSGLFGGGLPTITKDGWTLESVTLDWPKQAIFLLSPGTHLFSDVARPAPRSLIRSEHLYRLHRPNTLPLS